MMVPKVRPTLALLVAFLPGPLVTLADDVAGRVTTAAVPSVGRLVVARAETGGTIHLLCDSPDGPRYARSTDGGAASIVQDGELLNV
jgi:hypothetical protein